MIGCSIIELRMSNFNKMRYIKLDNILVISQHVPCEIFRKNGYIMSRYSTISMHNSRNTLIKQIQTFMSKLLIGTVLYTTPPLSGTVACSNCSNNTTP